MTHYGGVPSFGWLVVRLCFVFWAWLTMIMFLFNILLVLAPESFILMEISISMECGEPIEVTPGVQINETSMDPVTSQTPSQPVVHVEVRLTRDSIASRERVCQSVETFLRSKSGTCNLPAHFESGDFADSAESTNKVFLKENVSSINVSTYFEIG